MNPDGSFAPILAALYRATLDGAHWPAASALIDEACGVSGNALLVGEDLREGSVSNFRLNFARLLRRGESRPDLVRQWFQVYYPHDSGMPRLRGLSAGRLVRVSDLYTENELRTSPAYNEGWRMLQARNGLNVHFEEPDGLRLVWTLGDPENGGDWQSARIALIERLVPHVRQFVRVRQELAAAGALDTGLSNLLDNTRLGVLQLDRTGRLLAANTPALEILRHADGLSDHGGALHAWLPADHQRLRKLLGRALPAPWGEPPGGGSMILNRPSGGASLGLHVSPVGDPQTDFGGRRVAALVLVVDPAGRSRIDPVRVAAALGLTPAEGRVAALLAEGNSVNGIAAATGNRPGTVRLFLKHIYRKQGVSGQVPLVRRVLAVDALPHP